MCMLIKARYSAEFKRTTDSAKFGEQLKRLVLLLDRSVHAAYQIADLLDHCKQSYSLLSCLNKL